MAISTEKLLKLSQFQSGLQAAKNYTDGEIVKVNAEITGLKENAYDDTEVRGLIEANAASIGTNTAAIATLNGDAETAGSVDYKVANAIAGVMENPDETINSINELVTWTQDHAEDALQLSNNVSANGTAITGLQEKVDTGDQTVSAYVNGQGFLKTEDVVINVATDEEVAQVCNTVFGTTAA